MKVPVFSANSLPRFIWDAFIILSIIYSAVTIPLYLIFDQFSFTSLKYIDVSIIVLFLIDIFINFNSSYYESYHEIFDRKKIIKNYLKTWFLIDFLSTFPFEYIYLIFFTDSGVDPVTLKQFRMLRILRLLRLSQLFRYTSTFIKHDFIDPGFIRLFSFTVIVSLVSHFIACAWISIGGIDTSKDYISQYVDAIYWTIVTLTTVGYGDITATNNTQKLYTILVMLSGVAFYAYVIGNIANIISNLNFAKIKFINKIDSINAFLKYNKVPKKLQNKIKSYYHYVWNNNLMLNEFELLKDLPHSYQRELALFLNEKLIQKVPLFKNANEQLIHDLVSKLKPVIYSPGEIVFRKSEFSEGMYFINSGKVLIKDPDRDNKEIVTLEDGEFFGEMSLLLEDKHNYDAVVKNFSELHRLSRYDFEDVLKKHPGFKNELHAIITQRKNE